MHLPTAQRSTSSSSGHFLFISSNTSLGLGHGQKFSTGNELTEISLSLLTEEYSWSKKISFRVSEISTGHAGLARISMDLSLLTEYP
jgi:hypothetical protein